MPTLLMKMSSLKEELRVIDTLSDNLRDIERDICSESQFREELERTRHEQVARRESLNNSITLMRESKARVSWSIQEKESFLGSSKLLEKVARTEIHRLEGLLNQQSRERLQLASSVKHLCSEMEELVVKAFGPSAVVQGTHMNAQRLKAKISDSKALLGRRKVELSRLEAEANANREKLKLQTEARSLESDVEALSAQKAALKAKIQELKAPTSPARPLSLNVSLEASTYMKYPKLMDGSSFFKKVFEKKQQVQQESKTPEKRSLKFPNLLLGGGGSSRASDDRLGKAKRNLTFAVASPPSRREESPTPEPVARSPYFSPTPSGNPSSPSPAKSPRIALEAIPEKVNAEPPPPVETMEQSDEEVIELDNSGNEDDSPFNFGGDKDASSSGHPSGKNSFWGDTEKDIGRTLFEEGNEGEEGGGGFMFGSGAGASNNGGGDFFSSMTGNGKESSSAGNNSFFK